ncbi:MAG: glutamate 5-kinase [Gammaproteobacteria bacterium]|nr:MAG: glutamate 5-kinase [Gammaproteobacteria bacterium]
MRPSTGKASARRWVIKIGSALLTDEGRGLDHAAIRLWVDEMAALRKAGIDLVLVSSGSIVEGMSRLGLERRPQAVYELQGLAAVGQMGLIQVYESFFQNHSTHTAQILMTREDFANRARYLNARSTLRCLLGWGVVPVVNENDSVATDEIRLGDNDTLAGLVANLVEAELLVVLTDQKGLFTGDPRTDPDAKFVPSGKAGDPALLAMAGDGSSHGRGGMRTKLAAAALAARSGAATRIASGREPEVLTRLADGESIGTLLVPDRAPLAARKQWLAGQLEVRGRLRLDAGASEVLTTSGRSLLAVGVKAVDGDFQRGEMVACHDPEDREIARGMVNYSAEETRTIMGHPSERIVELLGYVDEPELIHRDNLVLM